MFELAEKPAQLVAYNPFAEKHGEAPVPAASARLKLNLEAHYLDSLHPALRRMFYYKAGDEDVGDLANQAHDAPNLRAGVKLAGPHKWAARFVGYQLRVHIGASERGHVVIPDCELDKITFDPQEGGTVIFGCTLIFHPDERIGGKLGLLVGKQVDVSLTPPEGGGEVLPKDPNEPAAQQAEPEPAAVQ